VIALLPFLLRNWRGVLTAAALAALIGFGLYYRHQLIVEGEQKALQEIEHANEQEQSAALRAATGVVDCDRAGGDWDRAVGMCVGSTSR